jgi:GrpB-like predicted nucleotidyltransferase (UPF0157 family)
MDEHEGRARMRAGGPVLVDYDPAWPACFEEAASAIRAASGGLVITVEHIGSTAVAGLRAKPVIDLMPGLGRHEDGPAIVPAMAALGYEYRGEYGVPGRHYFTQWVDDDPHAWKHNVHCYAVGHREWVRHLVFRDALRADPVLRAAYAALKDELALRFPESVEGYAEAKSVFVERVIREAGGPERAGEAS